jgi:flagellar assembly protein FliH
MRSLSKVLKQVKLQKENPLRLISPKPPLAKKVNESGLDNTRCRRTYEEEANLLLEDALSRARKITSSANDETLKIILEAQSKKKEIEKEAFEKGYKDGFEQGLTDCRKEQEALWSKHMLELQHIKNEIEKHNINFKSYLEKECFKLSLHIAEKILGEKIEIDGTNFMTLIKKGLEEAGDEKNILIRVSEADLDRIAPHVSTLNNITKDITWIKDPFLNSGDCIIEGPHFEIDAGIRTQIEHVASVMRELEVIDNEKQ